jgi:hypothetical protein
MNKVLVAVLVGAIVTASAAVGRGGVPLNNLEGVRILRNTKGPARCADREEKGKE